MGRWGWFLIGILLSVVFFLGACAPSTTTSPTTAPPGWAEFALDRYPLVAVRRAMTDTELTKLELVRKKLERDTFVFNYYRGLCPKGQVCGKWELFPAGTEVAVDKDGRPWYKVDCTNRLYVPVRNGPAWWPFGGGGPRWPWWLPWLLLLPLLGLLGWLFRRQGGGQEPPPPGNGNGGGNGPRPDPLLGPGRAAPPSDHAAARRTTLGSAITMATAAAEAHEAEAARLSEEGRAATDDDETEQKLRAAHDERQKAKAARAQAAAKATELAALGKAATPTPVPQSAPAPIPPATPDEKGRLLVSLRSAEKEAGIRHRALRVAIDALEQGAMTPEEVRGWLQKLGITLP